MTYKFWPLIALLIISCAVKSRYTTGDCFYSESSGDIRIDSIVFLKDELSDAKASSDTTFLMLYYNPNAKLQSSIKFTLTNGRIGAYKSSPDLRKELKLGKNDMAEIHQTLKGKLVFGIFLQQCKSSSFDGTANLIVIKCGKDELLYFSPYDSPLQLNPESRKSLGDTFRLIEIASSLYWKN